MNGQEKFDRFVKQHPHEHKIFFQRPHWTRRNFFEVAGAGVVASYLAQPHQAQGASTAAQVKMKNTAKNVVFILLAGAPSHSDTFDLKMVNGVTPTSFNPTAYNGVLFPQGLMPKLADQMADITLIRSMRSWALVHSLGQTWTQIGRNPLAALGNVAPNIGSVVAIEKDIERKAGQVFPAFVALNSGGAANQGYFSAKYAPFKYTPSTVGIPNTANADGQTRMDNRWSLLHKLDDPLRVNSPNGKPLEDYDSFYSDARGMMYNQAVTDSFKLTASDTAAYGNTGFGNACAIAVKTLKANQGTRFVQITLGGWDMHQNIYTANQLPALTRQLDNGLSQLMTDLKAAGIFDQTLVVMAGEFGRTVGALSAAAGRDHFLQQFAFVAGGGTKGGRAIGATNATASDVTDYGWARNRYVRPEDIEATIYSALGINWTTQRDADLLGRSFEYVPFVDQDLYGPVEELWG